MEKFYLYLNPKDKVDDRITTYFVINPNEPYYIFITDPNYFLMTLRPGIFPGIVKLYQVYN